jgi:alanine racemase
LKEIFFSDLDSITGGSILQLSADRAIVHLCLDSRKAVISESALFFAVTGARHDGHQFIEELYDRGLRQFVVERRPGAQLPGANIILVRSSVEALQKLAAHHRSRFAIPVIAVTGSNGKTIVKEWVFQLIQEKKLVTKNPGSYNSQTGVPLSVWQLNPATEAAVFEAGISRPGEMEKLQQVIRPTVGVFTNLGPAHDEGFADREEKAAEKLKLFRESEVVVYCRDQEAVDRIMTASIASRWTWGRKDGTDVQIVDEEPGALHLRCRHQDITLSPPFSDTASIENMMHAVATLLYMGVDPADLAAGVRQLRPVSMRMQVRQGINHCVVIDDSYNNDLAGLRLGLDFLDGQLHTKKSLILSELLQTGLSPDRVAGTVAEWARQHKLLRIELVGATWKDHQHIFQPPVRVFDSVDDYLRDFDSERYQSEAILVKGARPFQFERIARKLERKVHGTVMEIDQGALIDNLNFFRSRLYAGTRIMVMVKAFAYGSGSLEVASLLQYHRVDYLGVAYPDEGIQLRRRGIHLPILVMNTSEEAYPQLLEYRLEPEVYSLQQLQSLALFLDGRTCRVHLKFDTGMHRLGLDESDIDGAIGILEANKNLEIASVFSHLAGADAADLDAFSAEQAVRFSRMCDRLSAGLGFMPVRHLLNSAGILRLPEYQFEMVRLGIGLFGIDPTSSQSYPLKPVTTLKTVVSQVKRVRSGDSIGYGRKGRAMGDIEVATIAIGYADGFSRAFSQGKGVVMIRGRRSPVLGNVCMDMTMVDVTGMGVKSGDEVEVYGPRLPLQEVADRIGTIPYEILTSTSDRVKRVFYAESM